MCQAQYTYREEHGMAFPLRGSEGIFTKSISLVSFSTKSCQRLKPGNLRPEPMLLIVVIYFFKCMNTSDFESFSRMYPQFLIPLSTDMASDPLGNLSPTRDASDLSMSVSEVEEVFRWSIQSTLESTLAVICMHTSF